MTDISQEDFESRLIPIMRDGIELVKMIFYKKLKSSLTSRYPERETTFCNLLTGAMVNEIYGTPNPDEPFYSFVRDHRAIIDGELGEVASYLEEMIIPLTDSLRMQDICDRIEEINSKPTLQKAQELGILIMDRDLPLPHSFMHLVRKMGNAFGLIIPPLPEDDSPTGPCQ